MQRCAPTFQSACQSILYERECDACGESTRMTTIIENLSNQWAKALRAAVASMDEYKD